nr:MAG TPA: hypothetical protein [Caudoviricetes sp.]
MDIIVNERYNSIADFKKSLERKKNRQNVRRERRV